MRERLALLVAVFATLAVGCGGSLATPESSQESSQASPEWSPLCPATPPAVGSSCTDAGSSFDGTVGPLVCEYGYLPWSIGCATLFECTGAQWGLTGLGLSCTPDAGAPAPLPADCPPTFASAQETGLCAVPYEACVYDQARECLCLSNELGNDDDRPDPENEWTCALWDPACPSVRPRIGSPCSGSENGGEPTTCQYNGPPEEGEVVGDTGITVQCIGGVWTLD